MQQMDNESQKPLEELIHRELSKLPELQAPDTLIQRVFASIQAEEAKPWWQRPWTTWPTQARIVAWPVMLATAAMFILGVPWLINLASGPMRSDLSAAFAKFLNPTVELALSLGSTLFTAAEKTHYHWFIGVAAVIAVMYLSCIGIGTLCFRVASHHLRR